MGSRAPVRLALAGVLLLAALLRLWRLDVIPPGLNHDEAVNSLDVQHIIAGWRPVFLPVNNGREALFMYFQAVVGAIAGVTPTTLRLTAALCGIATVAATFGLARHWYGSRAGLLAGGLLAVAFWHVVLSRVGLRAIVAPPAFVLVFWTLSVAWQRQRLLLFALGGVLLGLAQYTYISARLLPPLLLLICALLLWRGHRLGLPVARRLVGLTVAVVAAVVTALPEGIYFLRHPDVLIGRTDQVLVFNSHPSIIGQPITFEVSLRRTLGMFWVQGDGNWLHNIAGLPLLDPLLTAAFLAGAALVLAGVWRGRHGPARGAGLANPDEQCCDCWPALWLLAWFAVLLAGSSVTQESPNYLRLTALMPAVAIVCALGLEAAAVALPRLGGRRMPVVVPVVLLMLIVLGEGARTARLYFVDWAGQGGVYTAFDTDIRDAAIASLAAADVPMADTMIQLDASSPFLFFRPQSAGARWLREYSSVVALPPAGRPGLWIYSHVQARPSLPVYLPAARLLAEGDTHAGHPGYFLYNLDAAALAAYRAGFRPPAQPVQFGGELTLVGSRLDSPSPLRPGGSAQMLLLWRVDGDASANFGVSVHLIDDHSRTWAQSDLQGMMRDGWRAGDLFVSRHVLTLPDDTPAIGLQAVASAALLDPLHQPAAVLAPLGVPAALTRFEVQPGTPGDSAPPAGARAVVPGLDLVDAQIDGAPVKPGEAATVMLRWLRTAPLADVSTAVALLDGQGRTVATATGAPGYGAEPLATLPPGRVVADPRSVTLPAVVPAGPLQAVLVVSRAGGQEPAPIALGSVRVQDRVHSFAVPASQHALSARFGGQVALLGYDLADATSRPGSALTITLNLQAIVTPERDYTVFVHLLDAGGHIVAQSDSQPAEGSLPTRSWLPREVVADTHRIALPATLPAGTYRLEVGVYDGATGKRIVLDGEAGADHLELPAAVTVR